MKRARALIRRLAPPGSGRGWAVFAAALALLALLLLHERRRAEADERARLEATAQRAADYLQKRLETYEEMLRGFAGFFSGSHLVEPDEFAVYCHAGDPAHRLPGFLAAAFEPWAVDGRGPPGYPPPPMWTDEPDLVRKPVAPAGRHAPILYRCPAAAEMTGYDMSRPPDFAAALEAALRSGQPAASRPVPLGDPKSGLIGLLLALPVSRAQARPGEPPLGFVTLAFETGAFFASLVTPEIGPATRLDILQQGKDGERRVYSLGGAAGEGTGGEPSRAVAAQAAGRRWIVRLTAPTGLEAGTRRALAGQFWLGFALCGALGLLVGSLNVERRRLEVERDALARSEAARGELLARVTDGVVAFDREWLCTHVNERAGELCGRAPAALVGRSLWSAFPEGFGREFAAACQDALATGRPERVEVRDAARDRVFEHRIYPSPNGVTVFITELTARVREARRREEARAAGERRGALLLEIARCAEMREGDLIAVYRRIAGAAAAGLAAGRAGLWFFNPPRTTLVCEALHDPRGGGGGEGALLEAARHPAYFAALAEAQVIDAADAAGDPRTRELAADYLAPLGIGAALDVPLRRGGDTVGVLRVEHLEGPRAWSGDEAIFAAALCELAGTALETAERRLAERALSEREAHYRAIFDSAPIGIYQSTREGRILTANPALARLLGHPAPEAMIGLEMARDLYFDPEERERLIARWGAAERGPPVELRFKRSDGSPVWVQLVAHAVRDDEGRVRYFEGFIHDITDRFRALEAMHRLTGELEMRVEARTRELAAANAALRERTALLTAVTEGTPDAIYVKDAGGRYRFINSAGARYLSRVPGEVTGRTDEALMDDAAARAVRRMDESVLASGTPQTFDDEISARSERRIFHTTKGPLRDAEGRITGLFGISRDITERRRQEAALERLNDELRGSNAELQRLNADLEAFAGSVAHDLRTPLQTILGFTDALRTEAGPRLGRDGGAYLGRIEGAVSRMTELLDGLLALARAARAQLLESELDLAAMARELAGELAEREPGRKVAFEVPRELPARGDAGQLRVLLANLLGNAWKFTARAAGPRVVFGERREGGARVFFVRDNGAGFDPARASRLFKPFQRLHSAGEFPGTGVGLATAARIVARHGGKLWAESAPGEGASFFFTLPGRKPGRESF